MPSTFAVGQTTSAFLETTDIHLSQVDDGASGDENLTEIGYYKSELVKKDQLLHAMKTRLLLLESHLSESSPRAHDDLSDLSAKCSFFEDKYEKMKSMYNSLRVKHMEVLQQLSAKRRLRQGSGAVIDAPSDETSMRPEQLSENTACDKDGVESSPDLSHIAEMNKELKEQLSILTDSRDQLQAELRLVQDKYDQLKLSSTSMPDVSSPQLNKNVDNTLDLPMECGRLQMEIAKLAKDKQAMSEILNMNRNNIAMLRSSKMEMEGRLMDAVHEHVQLQSVVKRLTDQARNDAMVLGLLRGSVSTAQELNNLEKQEVFSLWAGELLKLCLQCALARPRQSASRLDLVMDVMRFTTLLTIPYRNPDHCCLSGIMLKLIMASVILDRTQIPDEPSSDRDLDMAELFCTVASITVILQNQLYRQKSANGTDVPNSTHDMHKTRDHIYNQLRSMIAKDVFAVEQVCADEDLTQIKDSASRISAHSPELARFMEGLCDLIAMFANPDDCCDVATESEGSIVKVISTRSIKGAWINITIFGAQMSEKVKDGKVELDTTGLFRLREIVMDALSFLGVVCCLRKVGVKEHEQLVNTGMELFDTIESPLVTSQLGERESSPHQH